MKLSELINDYGKRHAPYMKGLINHLPMGQLALYQMTNDLQVVKSYSEYFQNSFNVNAVKAKYPRIDSIEACLGKRELYESCLALIDGEVEARGMNEVTHEILNTYPLGMSSGLFHVIIRLAYAIEGVQLEDALLEEAKRALAYYVTAYRGGSQFNRKVQSSHVIEEMNRLMSDSRFNPVISSSYSMGQIMKTLYRDPEYLESGFLIEGNEEDKVRALLGLFISAFNNTSSIVVLHCITGLHSLLVLKDYFNDFEEALNIFTTCSITHQLTLGAIDLSNQNVQPVALSWNDIIKKGTESLDVHTIKFTYSCHELYKRYAIEGLKGAALSQIRK
ncbi:hypothetical protein Amet_1576 [Alkaliphilus metalliredigens QYMF]|uniref:Uncharacterized protein n=1 Tax=Alkaliphilus metalliredigens (strain QYMF) TaxID=293826 RepID=A6TNI7_ALKMQ|nr:questin oxidase family protein [Alkaliphilus metalliredigens]ABR47755.1 hypothetical protein Amet_1576 [Alkaliphilus metalliredigens QYMF]